MPNLLDKIADTQTVPNWIDQAITYETARDIAHGGCASGCYMPAVTYYDALLTMQRHGDDIFEYIDDNYGEIPDPDKTSWSHMAVFYLSLAVEAWAHTMDLELEQE